MPHSHVDSKGGGDPRVEWLRERLEPPESFVASSWIPSGFEAYARILHPVQEGVDKPLIRWADVARWSGVALVPTIQWYEAALPEDAPDADPPWTSQGPREGSLSHEDTIELAFVLSRHTSGLCFFGVWEGYGGVTVQGSDVKALPRRVEETPTFELPWRSYELYEGPVAGAMCFRTPDFQSPNLWWPQDQSWCVASEIDLPWTYVAASRELIDELLTASRLEVLEISPNDPIRGELPTWLDRRIGAAVDEVIDAGSATLVFALGTVTATLTPGRTESVLVSRSERRSGWGSATSFISSRDSEVMRRDVRRAIERAVFSLVQV